MIRIANKYSGFSIMEALIAMSLLAALAIAASTFFKNQLTGITSVRTLSTRDNLKNLLQRSSGDGKAMANSAVFAGNTMLDYCVNGTGGNSGCVDGVVTDFTMVDANNGVIAGPGIASPAVFDTSGAPCSGAPTPKCPIISYASFTADCGGVVASCKTAERITVFYTIKQAPGVDLTSGTPIKEFTNTSNPTTLSIPLNNGGGNGIVNRLAKWDTTTTMVESGISEHPASKNVRVGENVVTGPDAFGDNFSANVGVGMDDPLAPAGTTASFPNSKLDVNGTFSAGGNEGNIGVTLAWATARFGKGYSALRKLPDSGKMMIGWNHTYGWGETDIITNRGLGGSGGVNFYDIDNGAFTLPNRIFTIMGTSFMACRTFGK